MGVGSPLQGISRPRGKSKFLAIQSPCDTNSIEEPTRITPITQPATGLGPNFTRVLPPFSITVLEIQCP
jgi:hypothetical protein